MAGNGMRKSHSAARRSAKPIPDELRLETILRVSQLQASSLHEILDFGLSQAIEVTGSRMGNLYFYDEEKRRFTLHAWSEEVMALCRTTERETECDLESTGLSGESVRQRKPVVVNNYQAPSPLKKGCPEGHAPLDRYLSVPVFSGDRIVAVVAVANKETDYSEVDVQQLTLLMNAVWRLVERHDADARLREGEERYRSLFANLPVAVLELDLREVGKWIADVSAGIQGSLSEHLERHPEIMKDAIARLRVLEVNQAAVALFESDSRQELIDRLWETSVEEGMPGVADALVAFGGSQRDLEIEIPSRSLRGKELFVSIRIVATDPVPDRLPERAVLVVSDLTERKATERRLKLFGEIGRAILGAEPAATLSQTAISRLRDIVPYEFAGVRLPDEAGRGTPLIAHIGDEELPQELVEAIPSKGAWLDGLSEGVPILIEDLTSFECAAPYVQNLRSHGLKSLLVMPMRARIGFVGTIWLASKQPAGFGPQHVGVVRAMANELAIGIQQAMLYEKSRAQALEMERRVGERTSLLESANKELESFCYSVSHDLRGPLRAIEGFSAITQEDWGERLDDEARENLGRIRTAAQRMAQLIEDLLALTRFTRSSLDLSVVDVSSLVHEVVNDLLSRGGDRRPEFAIAPGATALADPAMLKCLLENLLDNAWKYTAGTSHPRIEFGCAATDGEVVFFVRDNGCGFDMAYAKQLFLPFHRLHRADEYSGTGIGLATAQRIVARHGGRIWAEGAPGEGATFRFTLGS